MSNRISPLPLAVFALAVLALLCCELGPAWSPDGKSVAFTFAGSGDARGLARHDVEPGTTTIVSQGSDWGFLKAAYDADGKTLFAIAGRGEEEEREMAMLRIAPDGGIRVLTAIGEKGADSLPFGPVFVRDGKIWCCAERRLPAPPEATEEEKEAARTIATTCIDPVSGELSWPFGVDRAIFAVQGPAGLFYAEPLPEGSAPAHPREADDPFAGGFAFGRVDRAADGTAKPVELGRRVESLKSWCVVAVGTKHLAFLCGKTKSEDSESETTFLVVFDLESGKQREVSIGNPEDAFSYAFGPGDARLWIASEDGLVRIDVASGAVSNVDAAALAGAEVNAVGLSPSPPSSKAPILAVQLFAKEKADSQSVPDLLLIDEASNPVTAKVVKAVR